MRYVILVDTPGFDDTYTSDLDILNMISDWLDEMWCMMFISLCLSPTSMSSQLQQ